MLANASRRSAPASFPGLQTADAKRPCRRGLRRQGAGGAAKPATLIRPWHHAAAGVGALAWSPAWCGGLSAAGGRRCREAGQVCPAHLHRLRSSRRCLLGDRPLPLLPGGAVPPPDHAGPVSRDLRLRAALLRSPAAARFEDVDIDAGVLQIRDAKGGKDRQLPVSEPLLGKGWPATTQSSPGEPAGTRSGSSLAATTRRAAGADERQPQLPAVSVAGAGSPHGGRGHGPRVHDLRHSMAVNNLRSWFARGENVDALLPVLQTYLGHSSIGDTAYYLHLTAESYPDVTARVQQTLGDVVAPPVTGREDRGD